MIASTSRSTWPGNKSSTGIASLVGADAGDVGDPHLVRFADVELLLNVVGGDHRPAVIAAALAQITQVVSDFAVALGSTALQPSLLDEPSNTLLFAARLKQVWLAKHSIRKDERTSRCITCARHTGVRALE